MKNNKPNILWICTDQQRFDTLGCYGNSYVHTPNLDKLAESGVRFNHAYSQSPVCSPSRASFLTGRYPRVTGVRQNGQMMPKDEVLVPKLLKDMGYNCGLAGKLHIGPCHASVCQGTEERIDDGYSVFHWSHGSCKMDGLANNEYHVWLRSQGLSYDTPPYQGSKQVNTGMPEEYHQTKWCTDRAIDFIEANTACGNPWMFSINYFDPHHPFDPPEDYLKRYLPVLDEIPLPNYQNGELEDKSVFQQRENKNGGYNGMKEFCYDSMTDRDHRLVKAAYWAMIDVVDHQVGRLIDFLEKNGLLENTMIIFTSDHGEMLGDHGIYLKGPFLYDCCVRVPLIISYPGIVKSNVSDALVELVDLAPTIMEAVGNTGTEGMQGQSLWKLLKGEADINVHREEVMAEYYNAMTTHKDPLPFLTMIRTREFKLICQHGQEHGELYDMIRDPDETVSRWNDSHYADIRFQLLKKMCDRVAFTCDPLPVRQAEF